MFYQSSRTLIRFFYLVWRRRRALELRMLPEQLRRRKQTPHTPPVHSVSRKGPLRASLVGVANASTKRTRVEAGLCMTALNFLRGVMRRRHGDGNRLIARSKRTRCRKKLQCMIGVQPNFRDESAESGPNSLMQRSAVIPAVQICMLGRSPIN